MSTLREFVERASAKIEVVFNATGEVLPMYHFVIGAEDVVLPAPPGGKDIAVAIMREIFKKTGTHRYVFIDEAWLATEIAPPDTSMDDMHERMKTMTPPSERPDRKEVVIFMAEDETEGYFAAQREIIRDADGKGTLGPLECDEQPKAMMGRMTGLLPAKGTIQ
jgi:hypothetical protein